MTLCEYLEKTEDLLKRDEQKSWFANLEKKVRSSIEQYQKADEKTKQSLQHEFLNRVRTEEIKAWYSAPDGEALFQGTSISSLVIPCETDSPLLLENVGELEESIADAYIKLHNTYAGRVKNAIMEDVDEWIRQGLYYGVVLSSKLISQAFGLSVSREDVVFRIGDHTVDPHEILSYPDGIRQAYFKECLKNIEIFKGINLEQKELESSLVLADISKPKIKKFKDRILLAPIRCNEISAILSERIADRIIEKTSGRINPKSLTVVIYDTDTPYSYHQIMGYCSNGLSPVLPGLIVLGSSGTIDAFRWLYAYRISLIAQKIMKGSLYSEVHQRFIPYVFFGVLVPRDAEILLDMKNLHRLRYRGNFNPKIEFAYLMPHYFKFIKNHSSQFSWDDFKKKHSM